MSAEALQTGRAGPQRIHQGEPRQPAAAPFARPLLEGDDEAGPVIFSHQPRRHDPHHPGMPTIARRHQAQPIRGIPQLCLGLFQHHRLELLSFSVLQVQLPGEPGGLRGIPAQQQIQAGGSLPHAPPGVDSRTQLKTQREGGRGAGAASAHLHQPTQPRMARLHQPLQPLPDKDPVIFLQRHQVRHRGQGHQIQHRS